MKASIRLFNWPGTEISHLWVELKDHILNKYFFSSNNSYGIVFSNNITTGNVIGSILTVVKKLTSVNDNLQSNLFCFSSCILIIHLNYALNCNQHNVNLYINHVLRAIIFLTLLTSLANLTSCSSLILKLLINNINFT